MFLYDKNGNKIEVYSMEPNNDKIYEFKKEEIEKIPTDKRVLKATTNTSLVFENPKAYRLYSTNFVYQKPTFFNREYHNLESSYSTDNYIYDNNRINQLLNKYYKNEFKYKIPLCLDCEEDIPKYLLFTEFDYTFNSSKFNDRTLDNIICLTKNLYLLEKILDGKFFMLDEENIEKQIDLFDISDKPIITIDREELKKAELFKLINECENEVNHKVYESQKILKYVKK